MITRIFCHVQQKAVTEVIYSAVKRSWCHRFAMIFALEISRCYVNHIDFAYTIFRRFLNAITVHIVSLHTGWNIYELSLPFSPSRDHLGLENADLFVLRVIFLLLLLPSAVFRFCSHYDYTKTIFDYREGFFHHAVGFERKVPTAHLQNF